MESSIFHVFTTAFGFVMAALISFLMAVITFRWWVLPCLAYRKLKSNGFSGPNPNFPLGNLTEMKRQKTNPITTSCSSSSPLSSLSNDIHSTVFPYFATWQKTYGKVFVYWIGTEPFVYIADPEFLKQMSADIKGKNWGKATVFNNDRQPMFGKGLVTIHGDDWVRHRHVITPAFSPANLKAMTGLMVESAAGMVERWVTEVNSGRPEIDVEREIIRTAGEIIAKTSFGISYENGKEVLDKLRSLQIMLFKTNRFVGVPYGKFLNSNQTIKARKLGKEIDALLYSIVEERRRRGRPGKDLLGLLLEPENQKTALTTEELVDECKTFFFGGHETTALALSWTFLLLAVHPDWQVQLREEVKQVIGDVECIDATKLAGLKKMGWVMNEVLRLYCPAPNVQRQARHDIEVGEVVIPNGTNIWMDVVSMHHDGDLWGEDVNEFNPERFNGDIYGGCSHKMGFLPFGFGGRMCIGRNLTNLEYRVVLTLVLLRFSFSLSPNYRHSPSIMLSLRPSEGLPLIFQALCT